MVGGDQLLADPDESHAVLQLNGESDVSGEGGALIRRDIVALFILVQGLLAMDLTRPVGTICGTGG